MPAKLLRIVFGVSILWGLCLAVLAVNNNRDINSIAGNQLSHSEVFKRQPLNRSLLNSEMKQQLEKGVISENLFNIAHVLFQRDRRNDIARYVTALDPETIKNPDEFLDIYMPLFSTSNYQRQILYAQDLAKHAGDTAIFKALKSRLMQKPKWARVVLQETLKAETRAPEELVQIYKLYPNLQKPFLEHLIRTKRADIAYKAFLNFADIKDGELKIPYDSDFMNLSAPSPFNWNVDTTITEFASNGGVYLNYSGDGVKAALSQIIHLPPGNYKLSSDLSGSTSINTGYFEWSVICLEEYKLLAALKLDQLKPTRETLTIGFQVPEGNCRYQRLRLISHSGDFRTAASAEIFNVAIFAEKPG